MSLNIATAAKAILTTLGKAENAVTHGPALLGLITTAVNTAEGTAQTGDEKLADVLNEAEVFLSKAIPEAMADAQAILKAVEDFVNALVELYDETKAFVHGVEQSLTGKS